MTGRTGTLRGNPSTGGMAKKDGNGTPHRGPRGRIIGLRGSLRIESGSGTGESRDPQLSVVGPTGLEPMTSTV